jgi:signal transduction histidine kinase
VDIALHGNTAEAVIRFRDTGPGIPPEEIGRIWDRLFRGDKSRSQRGLGLGLSLVKAIVEAHRGRVEVVSQPGKGSEFVVYLPGSTCEDKGKLPPKFEPRLATLHPPTN